LIRIARIAPALSLTALLAACGGIGPHKEPEFTPMVLNEETLPESRTVQVPMPPVENKPRLARAQGASLWAKAGSGGGFFEDQRASEVGDILTVHIDISDKASLSNQSAQQRSADSSAGFPTFFGYESLIHKVLPGLGQDDLPTGAVVDLESGSSSKGSGSISRNEKINLKVAALIIQKLPNGNLILAGRQEVRVNNELRELRVAGIVRPEDIAMDNTISYDKIAEARIAYGGRGQLSAAQGTRYGQQALDIVLPY
jgi:flagellar L-ring protein FlgH